MNDLVVKHNALTNASYNLDLVEQRLVLLAIVGARLCGHGINANDPLTISANEYMRQFGTHRTTAYQALKDACGNLFDRRFSYQQTNKNGNNEKIISRWVSEIRYVDSEAVVKLIFAPAVVPLITELERHFTQYELEQVSELNSAYAVRLYELLIAWRSTGKTPIYELTEFRNKLGVVDGEYKLMHQFKQRVLSSAIEQINQYTDITVQYDQHKAGRVITGFSFTFKFKENKNKPKAEAKKTTTVKSKTQTQLERAYDLEHMKRLAELGGVPLETLLKRS